MKKIIIGLLALFISLSAVAQEYQKDLFESKVDQYKKMKRNGITMGIIGGSVTTLGVIILDQSQETRISETGETYTETSSSGIVGLGALTTVAGIPLFITGVILGVIGNKKEKEYKGKLDNLSFQIKSTPQMTGFSLVYNF